MNQEKDLKLLKDNIEVWFEVEFSSNLWKIIFWWKFETFSVGLSDNNLENKNVSHTQKRCR